MTREQLKLAQILQEAIDLLIELESYLALPDASEYQRIATEVLPRLAQLKTLIH